MDAPLPYKTMFHRKLQLQYMLTSKNQYFDPEAIFRPCTPPDPLLKRLSSSFPTTYIYIIPCYEGVIARNPLHSLSAWFEQREQGALAPHSLTAQLFLSNKPSKHGIMYT